MFFGDPCGAGRVKRFLRKVFSVRLGHLGPAASVASNYAATAEALRRQAATTTSA